ncbi:MAG: gluconate 2-dehydrogenase subunit 3 family protein [Bacteroidetes bacterium]|nr:gluconate 2-dehydrogenase subunit 3 family protein [Bacteroidota bacterium]
MDRRQAIQRAAMVLGYTVSAPAIFGVLNGCQAKPDLAFKPVFLTDEQAAIIAEVAEIIIPKTDTPGAKDAGVPGFIDLMLKDCYSQEDQQRFVQGLESMQAEAKSSYGSDFLSCKPEQQQELVFKLHAAAIAERKSENPPKDKPFVLMAKELTILGFFTSEPGATQVLRYEPVPGKYEGCVPLSSVGKTWAT